MRGLLIKANKMRRYAILLPTSKRSFVAVTADKETFLQLKKYRKAIKGKLR